MYMHTPTTKQRNLDKYEFINKKELNLDNW